MKKNRLQAKPDQEPVPLPKQAKINPDEKVIALTFDDGPNPATTNKILNALQKHEGHAMAEEVDRLFEKRRRP